MYPLFETIKVVDGELQNLAWHQHRVDEALQRVYKGRYQLDLVKNLKIPESYLKGVVKCRVSYGSDLGPVVFSHYRNNEINTLQQVECLPFDYHLKYQDRSKLKDLYQLRSGCDEILITHQGVIKDTSISNVALFDGNQWFTPSNPILKGTQRAKLLAMGTLVEDHIHMSDLGDFRRIMLINAMLEFDPERTIDIKSIVPWEGGPFSFPSLG